MVSEPINSSLFHQLAEQLQQQNLEQFQKQLLEHQQHQQKVAITESTPSQIKDKSRPAPEQKDNYIFKINNLLKNILWLC